MRRQPNSWTHLFAKLGIFGKKRRPTNKTGFDRRLRFEQCEDRRMLATFTVTNANDAVVNTPEAIGTLRQAIFDANQFDDADTINLASGLNGLPIVLTQGYLSITRAVTIVGNDVNNVPLDITIDASGNDPTPTQDNNDGSAVFWIPLFGYGSISGDVTLNNLTITGADGFGGGIYCTGSGAKLTITDCNLVNNHQAGFGGAIFFDSDGADLEIIDSTISGNSSQFGGGIAALLYSDGSNESILTIQGCTIADNTARNGGGVWGFVNDEAEIQLQNSIVTGNMALAPGSNYKGGGGLYVRLNDQFGAPSITVDQCRIEGNTSNMTGGGFFLYLHGTEHRGMVANSTISGNHAIGGQGGGAYICSKAGGEFRAINSTVSGNDALNTTNGKGGGLYISRYHRADLPPFISHLDHLTITNNVAFSGGGLFSNDDAAGNNDELVQTFVNHSIISGNRNLSGQPNNVGGDIEDSSAYNLLGTGGGAVLPTGNGNIISDTPGLDGLSDNGGFTLPDGSTIPSHALQENSPARNAGNPNFIPPPEFDERGIGFTRVAEDRIDIGAFEYKVIAAPQVMNVIVSSSLKIHDPYDFATQTFANPPTGPVIGTGRQIATVPVGGANEVTIRFNEAVYITDQDALQLIGMRTGNKPTVSTFTHTLGTSTATWKFTGLNLAGDQYILKLSDSVTDNLSRPLDGEWTNPGRLYVPGTTTIFTDPDISEFPSGNGEAGGEFQFVISLMPGDTDLNLIVNVTDLGALATHWQQQMNALFADADSDGDGDVDVTDLGALSTNWQKNWGILALIGDDNGDWVIDDPDLDNNGTTTQAETAIYNLVLAFGIDLDIVI